MSDPFLILHKVRGEPAFDIATKIECPSCATWPNSSSGCDECNGDGFWWIIPTSGHRAHPYWHHELAVSEQWSMIFETQDLMLPSMPDGWPDHYPSRFAPAIDISSVITALAKPSEPIERRF